VAGEIYFNKYSPTLAAVGFLIVSLFLVENQVKPLLAVEREARVARYERYPLGHGVGYDDVVVGVFVALPSNALNVFA